MSESFIHAAMGDAPEEGLAEEGRYDLRIVDRKVKPSKKGDRTVLHCMMTIEGENDISPIMQFITFPNEDDWKNEPAMAKSFLRQAKRFCSLFGVAWQSDGIEATDLDGAIGEDILVKIDVGDDGVERNIIALPRIDAGS
jgi:hypothetical protein